MSEQLETINCVDWTINFPGAVGGGADEERAHLWRQAALRSFSPQRCTWTALARSAAPPPVRPREATGLLRHKLAVNSGPSLSLSTVNHINEWGMSLPGDSVGENVTEACPCDCICVFQLLQWCL